ncbi:MAG TPA: rod shape-determining protein MreC [Sphingomonas sp.]|jgi:rod shape-determining protein MreC
MALVRDRRTGFSRRRQYGLFFGYVFAVVGVATGAVLLALSTLNPPAFAAFRMGAAAVTVPVSSFASATLGWVASVPAAIGDWIAVHSRNAVLERRVKAQDAVLLRARVIAYENRRLRALLAFRDRSPAPVVSARLVSSTASSGRRFGLLNAGRLHGVQVGMPVRGPVGLIGRVTETGPNAARVMLLVDPESIVPVRRTRDGAPAIAAGRGDGTLEIRSVYTTNVRFRAGDLFVTSGTGGLYPPGVPVARVDRAGSDTVQAFPYASPDTLDVALVERPFMMPPVPAR